MSYPQLCNVTSKEIAFYTVADIEIKYLPSMGCGFWENIAKVYVNDAFHEARRYRRSVTAVAEKLVELGYTRGDQFGNGMSIAVGEILTNWLVRGWLRGYEIKRARKMLKS